VNHESQKSVNPICPRKGINLRFTWMQPTITSRPVHRDGRVFEEKYDGWRMVAYEDGEPMQLISRRGRGPNGAVPSPCGRDRRAFGPSSSTRIAVRLGT
jgi:ATP-dependent DNA ligase